ncbi:unknown [Firmicutes bacterium CAG:321]|nr:unknown [Firmicutes bacterium CAG:321]
MKKINIKTIYLVAVISIGLICLAIGSTYAMFTTSAEINNPITISSNLTSNDDTMETFEVEVSPSATVTKTINISSGTVSNVNYSVWYINDISNIDIGVSSTSYTTAGTISNANTTVTTKISIRNNSSTTKTVTLGVALSKNSIVLASNMSLVPQKTLSNPLATHITNLYNNSTKTNVTNNGIKYQYDITNGLMKDADGNIRYSGLGDRNYVLFNCNTYPNTSCEPWRIIGVFDGKVKLIRNESIGTYPWDNKDTTTGAEADYGSNDWTTARLMKLLNPGYTKESVNNSLYYNSKGGQCYAGANNAETPCDFTYTGIKNDTTRNMIADAKWSLLGWLDEGVNVYADQSYKLENTSGTVYTGNKTSWTGKIALPYPSDYAYSAYLGKCTSTLGEYSNCSSWMKTMFNSKTIALLTPIVSSSFVFHVAGGCLDLGEPYAALDSEIFPTLYLNANVSIKTGSGTLNSPYQLSVG